LLLYFEGRLSDQSEVSEHDVSVVSIYIIIKETFFISLLLNIIITRTYGQYYDIIKYIHLEKHGFIGLIGNNQSST
jgi:hypothetical protein